MIRHYPEVPAGVELADVARHISKTEFMYPDPAYNHAWVWQSPSDFEPQLRVVVPPEKKILRGSSLIISHAVMVAVDGLTEYEQGIPITKAHHMEDDGYMEFFVESFRQYPHGRSSLELVDSA